ncbi:hypothetical protein GUITHDRAFT_140393 [Guillardia theta CCMP2712]|uniref:PX domain-containing protein n=1 Tax=Guillardia theta (strain CCMP2712) TaxID=905079 RepID=L1J534_GUITC|nr:hypothetical protein GUITHDRAFT_140393 [Guillardia theta CCMP2712]EKX43643.1 hypothetical protein GUITHDRAFT_140393 [Guillardia theta CCMP2712]|eukprot:XP_005830623.1 hypothetical protein GUITHDRAFT_140393 [Guillardia theta CCMP2712]
MLFSQALEMLRAWEHGKSLLSPMLSSSSVLFLSMRKSPAVYGFICGAIALRLMPTLTCTLIIPLAIIMRCAPSVKEGEEDAEERRAKKVELLSSTNRKPEELAEEEVEDQTFVENEERDASKLEEELQLLMRLVHRDFIATWFRTYISTDPDFLEHAKRLISVFVHRISKRLSAMNTCQWLFFIEYSLAVLREHIRCHGMSMLRMCENRSSDGEIKKEFEGPKFCADTLLEEYKKCVTYPFSQELHPGADHIENEMKMWRNVLHHVLNTFLPGQEEYVSEIQRGAFAIIREILTTKCLPLLTRALSDPDFINGILIAICKGSESSQQHEEIVRKDGEEHVGHGEAKGDEEEDDYDVNCAPSNSGRDLRSQESLDCLADSLDKEEEEEEEGGLLQRLPKIPRRSASEEPKGRQALAEVTRAEMNNARVVTAGEGKQEAAAASLQWSRTEKFASYTILVRYEDARSTRVSRRFMDFSKLHKMLEDSHRGMRVRLPERQTELQRYLDKILMEEELAKSEILAAFLAGPHKDGIDHFAHMVENRKKKGKWRSFAPQLTRGSKESSEQQNEAQARPADTKKVLQDEDEVLEVEVVLEEVGEVVWEEEVQQEERQANAEQGEDEHATEHTEEDGNQTSPHQAVKMEEQEEHQEQEEQTKETHVASSPDPEPHQPAERKHAMEEERAKGGRSRTRKAKHRRGRSMERMSDLRTGTLALAFFDVLDELLALSQAGWLRKHARILLRRLLNLTSYDLSVESKLLELVEKACQEETMVALFRRIRMAFWPEGESFSLSPPRTQQQREERARDCEQALKLLFTRPPLPMLLGRSGCDRAAMRVFQMLQTGTLNRHVVLVLLDAVFCSIFPEVRSSSSSSSYNLDGPKASCPFLPSRGQEGREQALEQALLQAMAQVEDLTAQLQSLNIDPLPLQMNSDASQSAA